MSPTRKTAGQKAAATRKRNAAKRQAAAKKAASTRKWRAAARRPGRRVSIERPDARPQEPEYAEPPREKQRQPAPIQPVQVQEPPASEPQVQATPETTIPE